MISIDKQTGFATIIKKPQQPEKLLHISCVQWFNFQYGNSGAILNHSPNENQSGGDRVKSIRYNATMKKMGRITGFPDLTLYHKGKATFIELKSNTGRQSDTQKEFQQRAINASFEYHIVRTLEEFMSIVNLFLIENDTNNL